MAPVRRGGSRSRSSSPAAGSSSRGRPRTTRATKPTKPKTTRTRGKVPTGRGLQERNRGVQRSKVRGKSQRGSGRQVVPRLGAGKRPGEDVVRDPGKPEPGEPMEEED